jgi:hypothetical protein
MSFDVFFYTCNLGTRKRRVKNAFTGEVMTAFDDPGLTPDERAAVAKLLEDLKAEGPDEFGFYSLSFPDGGEAGLSASGLTEGDNFDGCSVGTRAFTPDVACFLFRLSRAGNLVLIPAAKGIGPLVTSEQQRQRVAARFPDTRVVQSEATLEKELRGSFESWHQYRQQVLGDEE